MVSEREVRTRAGWIGVEISRSRVRTPGKAGFGLYRVRGARRTARGLEWSEWTDYALGLGAIAGAVDAAIRNGAPSGPASLITGAGVVPTRWTPAYTGRRDLGLTQGAVRVGGFECSQGLSAGSDEGDAPASVSVRSSVARRAAERAAELARRKAVTRSYARVFKARREVGLHRRHQAKLNRSVQ